MTTLIPTKGSLTRPGRSPDRASSPLCAPTLSVLTFNIGAAAVPRARDIFRWLRSRSDDVLVLTETSSGAGTELLADGLSAMGFDVRHARDEVERGVLVASRIPVAQELTEQLTVTLPCRVSGVVLDTKPNKIALVGVYIPSRDRSDRKVARKEAFIASMLDCLRELPVIYRDRLILAGDYNAVARHHEPPIPGFFPWEYGLHEELAQIGLRPAHELRPRRGHPHSWIGRTGLRYLYDYIHVGDELHRAVERCEYLHGPRERRLSDHAAVAARLRIA